MERERERERGGGGGLKKKGDNWSIDLKKVHKE